MLNIKESITVGLIYIVWSIIAVTNFFLIILRALFHEMYPLDWQAVDFSGYNLIQIGLVLSWFLYTIFVVLPQTAIGEPTK